MKRITYGGAAVWVLALLTTLAYGLRVIGADSSIAYIPDTQIIRQAFDLGQKLANAGGYDTGLSGGKYPFGLSWILLGVYGVIYVGGSLTGQIGSLAEFENFLFTHRTGMHMTAVLSLAIISAAVVPLLFLVSRRLNSAHRGWLAAGLGAFNLLMVQFSHQARPHAPLAVFALASVILLIVTARGGERKWAVAATLCSAMTVGILQNGIVILLPFVLAWIFRILAAPRRRSVILEGALNTVILLGLILLFYPAVFTDYGSIALALITGKSVSFSLGSGAHILYLPLFGLEHIPAFMKTVFNYQPFLIAAFPAAAAYFIWKLRKHPRELAVGIAFPLIQLLVWATYANSYGRITLILTPFFIIPVAYGLEDLIRAIARPESRRHLYGAAGGAILIPMLILAVRMVTVLARTDTRTEASRWVETNLPENSVILVNFQPLELTRTQASIYAQQQDFPGSLGTYDQWLLQQNYDADPSLHPAYTIVNGYLWGELSPRRVQEQGAGYLLISTTYASAGADPNPWVKFAQENGTLVRAFCPAQNISRLYLPEEIQSLSAVYLWRVERPGPIVLLYRLDGGPDRQDEYCSGETDSTDAFQ